MAEAVPDTSTPGPSTYEQDDFTVESNYESVDQIKQAFEPVEEASSNAVAEPVEAVPAAPVADTQERNADGTFGKSKKPRHDPQARIDEITAKHRAAERERDEARAENARLLAQLQPKPAESPKPEAVKPEPSWKRYAAMPDAPKLEDFDTIAEFNFAVSAFITDKQIGEREARQSEERQRHDQADSFRKTSETFHDKMAPAIADPQWVQRHADLTNLVPASVLRVVAPDQKITFWNALADQFLTVEHPQQVIEHLHQNRELLQRYSTLPPVEFFREIGRLDARFDAAPSAPASQPKISTAKPLIQPVSASPPMSDPLAVTDDLDVEEFIRRGNAADRQRHRA